MSDPEVNQSQLTGVAGVHFVASYLSFLGLHAVPTTRNVKGPDVLVGNIDGSRGLALQVKTTVWASRNRGRGDAKKPHHLEWEIGWASAKTFNDNLYFALVDLKSFQGLPDVYIVPSRVIAEYFRGGEPKTWIRARYHPMLEDAEPYRNAWHLLVDALIPN